MRHAARDFLIGLTALLGAVGVIATLVLFGEVALKRPTGYPFTLRLDQAEGLTPGGPVTMNGVAIGQLVGLRTAADPRDGVELDLLINEGVRVPRDVRVSIARDLVGDARLSLSARRGDPAEGSAQPGDPASFVQPGETLVAQASGVIEELSGLLDERLMALERAADAFVALSGTYQRLGERFESYLEPRTMAEVNAGAPPSLGATLERLDRTLSEAQAVLAEDGLRREISQTIERTNLALSRISETADEWSETARSTRRTAETIEERISEAASEVRGMTARLDSAAGELQVLLATASRGPGTVSQLINNPDLYNALVDASRRIERAVLEAQLLLEKYRKEGIPIQF